MRTGNALPVFKGYTVDFRLQQFRKMEYRKHYEVIFFDSAKGKILLGLMFEGRPEKNHWRDFRYVAFVYAALLGIILGLLFIAKVL